MKITPINMVFFYSLMGFLFMYLAILSVKESIWEWHTMLLMLIATFDFGVAIRAYSLHKKIKSMKK
ncbi:YdiK family protein [Sutcliffiella halmapala]|uniref:YdiK family protein n=1 Tax=Sutcliffiella halmapala TaxID=79882 RepID=UPI00099527BF|nr:YdiK family protein [Sutcliffiella halmapala]